MMFLFIFRFYFVDLFVFLDKGFRYRQFINNQLESLDIDRKLINYQVESLDEDNLIISVNYQLESLYIYIYG